jgi:hypothetical protein
MNGISLGRDEGVALNGPLIGFSCQMNCMVTLRPLELCRTCSDLRSVISDQKSDQNVADSEQ